MDVQNLFAQVEVRLLDAAELFKFRNAKIEPKIGGYELYFLLGGVLGDTHDAGVLAEVLFFGRFRFAGGNADDVEILEYH